MPFPCGVPYSTLARGRLALVLCTSHGRKLSCSWKVVARISTLSVDEQLSFYRLMDCTLKIILFFLESSLSQSGFCSSLGLKTLVERVV